LKSLNDGDKAVDLFKNKNSNLNIDNIDLIIIDLNMKQMNGDEACRIVKINIL